MSGDTFAIGRGSANLSTRVGRSSSFVYCCSNNLNISKQFLSMFFVHQPIGLRQRFEIWAFYTYTRLVSTLAAVEITVSNIFRPKASF
jgi:hypothetical protein